MTVAHQIVVVCLTQASIGVLCLLKTTLEYGRKQAKYSAKLCHLDGSHSALNCVSEKVLGFLIHSYLAAFKYRELNYRLKLGICYR